MALASATVAGAMEPGRFAAAHDRARALVGRKQAAAAAEVYGAFAAAHASDALAPLASILQGIVLRRDLGDGAAARAAFRRAATAPETPLGRRLKHVARAWLARLQMEGIDRALRRYYVQHVWYPETLDELVAARLVEAADLLDPWGKPFRYSVGPLRWAPKVPRQKHTLACSAVDGDSRTLAKSILKRADELERRIRLRAVVPTSPPKAIVTTAAKPDKRVTVSEGSAVGSATVAAVTRDGVVLVDGELVAFVRGAQR